MGRGLLLLIVVEGWLERWIDDSRDFYSSTLRFDTPTVATSLEAMESFTHHPPATSCVQRCAIIGHPVREGLCSIPHTAPARRGVPFTSCGCNDWITHRGVVAISVARRSKVHFRIAVQLAIWRIVCCRMILVESMIHARHFAVGSSLKNRPSHGSSRTCRRYFQSGTNSTWFL